MFFRLDELGMGCAPTLTLQSSITPSHRGGPTEPLHLQFETSCKCVFAMPAIGSHSESPWG